MTTYFEVANVTKRFGDKVALDDVSIVVSEPSIVGLVGKNGSGKTTLMRHIVGLQLPTSGSVTTLGCPSPYLDGPQLSRIGMAYQHTALLGWMSAGRLLRYVANFYPVWDEDLENHLVDVFEIDRKANVLAMSPGNRQKLSLVLAVCHHPLLLLLDEPLSDLDAIVRRDVIDALLDRFDRDEVAIVISSHLLNDLERFADRIIIMDEGRVLEDAPLDTLKEKFGMNLEGTFRQIVGAPA
jgi:ABC-2 type transport system ATP-binding protein